MCIRDRGGAIYDDNGQVKRVLGINIDITNRKKAEEILNTTLIRFYKILSSMSASVLLVTADNNVEFVNQEFCDYFYLNEEPEYFIGYSSLSCNLLNISKFVPDILVLYLYHYHLH